MDERQSLPVLVFDLRAKMAHFRKYYSNSSCLSYFIPPRTTIIGIVAGLLGRPRDEYYEEFSIDNCHIAVSVISPIKKIIQKMNYLHIEDSIKKLGSSSFPSQTPVEFVIPQNIREGCVGYRIWLHHRDPRVMEELQKVFRSERVYLSKGIALALGSAQCLGWIENVSFIEGENVFEETEVFIESTIPKNVITVISTEKMKNQTFYLLKEEVPLEFNKNRTITQRGKEDMIINLTGSPVPVIVKSYVKLSNSSNICWMMK